MKPLSISANMTSIIFDNVCTGAQPNLVIVNLVSYADLASGYQRNPCNFQNFGVNNIKLQRNGTLRQNKSYTPNFADGQYIKDYMTFLQMLDFETSDKSVSLTTSELANGYTLYVFKITDGFIGPGTYGPRSTSATISACLEVSFAAPVNEKHQGDLLLYQMLGKLKFERFNKNLVL